MDEHRALKALLRPCDRGTNIWPTDVLRALAARAVPICVVPGGISVQVSDIPELISEHFKNGRPLERLVNRDAVALRQEIDENRAKAIAAMRAQQADK